VDYPPDIEAELQAIKRLARTPGGPIADTYDRLQGLPFLRAAQPPASIGNLHERSFIALHQARCLAYFNAAHLLKCSASELRPYAARATDKVAVNLNWAYLLLRIAAQLSRRAAALAYETRFRRKSYRLTESEIELSGAISGLDEALQVYQQVHKDEVALAVGHGSILNGDAVVVHYYKLFRHQAAILQELPVPVPPEQLLSESILRLAVHALDTNRTSYLMQFRMLHQVPEILGAEISRVMTDCARHLQKGRLLEAERSVALVQPLLSCMVSCLRPLVELMLPSEYYRIRECLGVTSGSASKMLAERILSADYIALCNAAEAAQVAPSSSLWHELRRVRYGIREWRQLHLFLPWSILGADATSLIGSRHASDVVRRMSDTFDATDPLREPVMTPPLGKPNSAGLDGLLDITGKVTKRRFPKVEAREGRYRSRRGDE